LVLIKYFLDNFNLKENEIGAFKHDLGFKVGKLLFLLAKDLFVHALKDVVDICGIVVRE
jgi:hypothetical protein